MGEELTMKNTKWEKDFDKKFPCIQPDCDGKGNIPVQVGDDEWEADQCQFHAEYLFPLKDFISQEVKKERERIEKVVLDRKAGFKKTYRVADRHVFECVTEAVNHFLDDIIKEIRKDFPKE